MLTTNKLEPKVEEAPKKLRIITTNKLTPKEFNPFPDAIQGINKRETRKVEGGLLTAGNYKDRVEASKPKPVKKRRARRKKK